MTTRLRRLAARVRSNPAQFVVSVVIAALLAGATWLAALATGAWGQSTRLETRASSLAIEELRHLYQDQAPQALEIAVMLVRADALAAASTEDGDLLAMESATLRKAAGERQLSLRRTDSSQ